MSDLPKNTILITGGTSGLGYECAVAIARQKPDCRVIIASRSNPDDAATSINRLVGRKNVEYLALDLGSLSNIRAFVKDYEAKRYPPILALVLNAGLQFPGGVAYTADGVEKTFGVNHVGHTLLFHLLRPQLAADARVVVTSSGTHNPANKTGLPDAEYTTAEELAHPSAASAARNSGRQRYATSKLCNVLWAYALHRHFVAANNNNDNKHEVGGRSWSVTAFDPGLMPGTGLARHASGFLRFLFVHVLPHLIPLLRRFIEPNTHTAKESGEALARLAVGDDVEGVSGKYFEGLKEIKSSVDSYVVEKQDDLWNWTVKFVAQDQQEGRAFEEF